ncbi:FecR domain-containing protein [uncultured Sunxiuqinia sp.]|uniref:FecR family protein n=1 Tax=uncultured Sunxiuqinia sp. TaxID=1573825 RepID=UPI002AA81EE7|nr:FecR domain-containing protein [uncultured Sunxiuqinia sp.]
MKKEVEDILVEEGITEKKIKEEANASPKVLDTANQLYFYLITPKNKWSVLDKKQLNFRIQHSIETISRRKIRRIWFTAASVFIFAISGGIWYNQFNQPSAIADFANSTEKSKNDTVTRLVLSEAQAIDISEVESEIQYDTKGEEIAIGASQTFQQKLEPVKPSYNTLTVPYGKRSKITLSEGTTVWLNSGSKMVYPAVFAENKREVYLDGEAIFNVSKDPEKPFVVQSKQFNIEVIGTIFNLSAYSDDQSSTAVLKEGSIKLIRKTKAFLPTENKMISPGEAVTFEEKGGQFVVREVDPSDYLSWHYGYYVFKSETLGNILKKISRYYNIEINLKDRELAQITFSGRLDLKNNIEEVLYTIKKTTPFNFKEEEQRVTIY